MPFMNTSPFEVMFSADTNTNQDLFHKLIGVTDIAINAEPYECPTITAVINTIHDTKYIYPVPKKIIFNNPATIVYWEDGDKTVVKCMAEQRFDAEAGYAAAFMKKIYQNHAALKNLLNEKSNINSIKTKEEEANG